MREDGAAAARWAIAWRECENLLPFRATELLPLCSLQDIFITQDTEKSGSAVLAIISISPPMAFR
jgi:hypothetical protein